jgi:hypothetical protein
VRKVERPIAVHIAVSRRRRRRRQCVGRRAGRRDHGRVGTGGPSPIIVPAAHSHLPGRGRLVGQISIGHYRVAGIAIVAAVTAFGRSGPAEKVRQQVV